MLYQYSLSDLHNALDLQVNDVLANISPFYGAFFKVLQLTGLRPVEILNRDRWTYLSGTNSEVQCAKGSGIRSIDFAGFPDEFISFITTVPPATSLYQSITERTILRFWYDYFAPHHFYFADNESGSSQGVYIFRHMYVKDRIAEGYTVAQIATMMAELDQNNILGYVNSQSWCSLAP